MKVDVKKPTAEDLKEQGIYEWPIWEKEVSRFDWHYDSQEICYLLEGQAEVITPDGDSVRFGAGDLVRFPAGLSCTWEITKPVKKHFKMG